MIVSFAELKKYSGISKWPASAEDAAELILAGLQGELEAYLRRPIETAEFTEEYVIQYPSLYNDSSTPFYSVYAPSAIVIEATPEGPVTLPFRNTPVASISSMGYVSTSGSVSAIENGSGYAKQRYGADIFGASPGNVIRVTYTADLEAGFPGSTAVLKLLILRAATREATNLYDNNVGKQNFEGDPARALPTGFTQSELDSVKRYRRQRI